MTWWHYLLLANIYLTVFFGFYMLFLRRETFFNLNRAYLVGAAILSFAIPLIQVNWVKDLFITRQVEQTFSRVSPVVISHLNTAATSSHITLGQVVAFVYMCGMLILVVKFIHQLSVLRNVIREAETTASYSFFNNIKMEENDAENTLITAHELAHARQWHSADVLLIEAVMIINWFNPIVYFYRSAIKRTHEFIADRDALKDGADKAEYAMLLLSQTFADAPHYLVNPFFSHSMLKERIQMLQKNKSHRIVLFKYILSAPLFALALVLSSATVNNSRVIQRINDAAQNVFAKQAVLDVKFYKDISDVPEFAALKNKGHDNPIIPKEAVQTDGVSAATFPGGTTALIEYLSRTIKYPAEGNKSGVRGTVYVSFVIEKDGSLSDISVSRGVDAVLDKEALEAIKRSPRWIPGLQNGSAVRQKLTIPINFDTGIGNDRVDPVIAKAQNQDNDNEYFTSTEKQAEFPGGMNKFYQYLSRATHYPADLQSSNLQGKVLVTFWVETDGSLNNVKVTRGLAPAMDAEALRVVKASPAWKPGMQNGRKVRQQCTVPIQFTAQQRESSIANLAAAQRGEQLQASNVYNVDISLKNDSSMHGGHALFSALGSARSSFLINTKPVDAAEVKIDARDVQGVEIKHPVANKAYAERGINAIIKTFMFKKKDAEVGDER